MGAHRSDHAAGVRGGSSPQQEAGQAPSHCYMDAEGVRAELTCSSCRAQCQRRARALQMNRQAGLWTLQVLPPAGLELRR